MSQYDRQFDFGLRGYRETTRPFIDPARGYNRGYPGGIEERADPESRAANRVTARYNLDYILGPGDSRYAREYQRFRGEFPSEMTGERPARHTYFTAGRRGRYGAYRYDWDY